MNPENTLLLCLLNSLDDQHYLLVKVMGGEPIHACIPLDQLSVIADVGTGTG
jgi:hypothetical protein